MYVWQQVEQYIKDRPQGTTRGDLAAAMGVEKTTAEYHLKKLCERGLALRVFTAVDGGQRGWVYYHVSQMEMLPETDA